MPLPLTSRPPVGCHDSPEASPAKALLEDPAEGAEVSAGREGASGFARETAEAAAVEAPLVSKEWVEDEIWILPAR